MYRNFFIDFETFFDVGYSLRQQKINMTDYIRDERFEVLGASCAFEGEQPEFVMGPDLNRYLNQYDWTAIRQIGHHNLFDGFLLAELYGIRPARYFCTMGLMEALLQGATSVALDNLAKYVGCEGKPDGLIKGKYLADYTDEELENLAAYANNDLLITMALFEQHAHRLPEEEWDVMNILQRMFHQPTLQFDSGLLRKANQQAIEDRQARIQPAIELLGTTEEELRGNAKFPELLKKHDIEYELKPNKDGVLIPALAKTDAAFQQMLESNHEHTRVAAEARLAVKSTQAITRTERFIALDRYNGRCPVAYNYYRAHTGRCSGANKINMANLKRGSDLRKSIVAPPGYVLGVADSSQIEARTNAYLAGQHDLIKLFRQGLDPYNDMAGEIFGRPVDRKNNPDDFFEGFIGKTAVLGLGFNMGGPKFKDQVETQAKVELGIDIDYDITDAFRVVNTYRRKNYRIAQFWKTAQSWLEFMANASSGEISFRYPDGQLLVNARENKIWFPFGTYLYYPSLAFNHEGDLSYVTARKNTYINKKIYGGLCVENIVQKFARDIVMWQMLNIDKRYQCVMTTYDEIVALLPEEEADDGLGWMLEQLRTSPPWAASIPLAAEGGWAKEYSK